jgi:hypothetical protein
MIGDVVRMLGTYSVMALIVGFWWLVINWGGTL